MSLLTTTSLIVVWCTLEVVNSQIVIPPPAVGNQYQDFGSYPVAAYQMNTTHSGSQDSGADSSHKDGKSPYKMFYIEKDQFRCEECDEKGTVRGNMTYVDGKSNAIRTVKYETTDIPLQPNAQEGLATTGPHEYQQSFQGPQLQQFQGQQLPVIQGQQLQGQQSVQGQQLPIIQGQQLVQGQQLPLMQGQQLQLQPQVPYNTQTQAQGQNYQGNTAVFGPLNYPMSSQQPATSQLQVPSIIPQNPLGALQSSSNFAATASSSFPFALEKPLPEAVSSNVFAIRPTENRADNPGLNGQSNAGSITLEALAADAMRNLQQQPQPIQTPPPTLQQPQQPAVLNDNGFGNLARRLSFINSQGVDDKPQGLPALSSPVYQQPLFSATSPGMTHNRDTNGAYDYLIDTPNIFHKQVADEKNNVVGTYAFKDPNGGKHFVQYDSGPQGFNARARTVPGAPQAVMPAVILVQQPSTLGQQVPFTLVPAGTPATANDESADKAVSKEDDSTKQVDNMPYLLSKLAKEIVANMGDKSSDNVAAQTTAEDEQPPETR